MRTVTTRRLHRMTERGSVVAVAAMAIESVENSTIAEIIVVDQENPTVIAGVPIHTVVVVIVTERFDLIL